MAVLINRETGLAEDLGSQELAQQAIASGKYDLPLVDAQGEHVIAPMEEAQNLLSQGYAQPSPEQLGDLLKYSKHSSTGEQLKTFAEGALNAATFGASAGIERALLDNAEEQLSRREVNPGVYGTGQAAGLVGSALAPIPGAAQALTGAGKLAAEVAGLGGKGASLVSRATATGVKNAVETALFQSGDEVARALISDPEQSANSALMNIGMAGLLGGAVTGVGHLAAEPLWNAAKGSSVANALRGLKDKVMSEGLTIPGGDPDMLMHMQAAEMLGVEIPESIKAAVGGNQAAKDAAAGLFESQTRAGKSYQSDLLKFKNSINDSIQNVLGKRIDDVPLSDYERGIELKKNLIEELKAKFDPISKIFDDIKEKYGPTEVSPQIKTLLSEDLGQMAISERYTLQDGSKAMREINKAINDVKNLQTVDDITKYQSLVRQSLYKEDPKLANDIIRVFRDYEERALGQAVGFKAPHVVAEYEAARAAYKPVRGLLDSLDDRLHVGFYKGPGGFVKALSEMSPEDVLRRMRGQGDADLLGLMQSTFPKAAESVKGYHTDQLLSKITSQGELNTRQLFRALDKMSPELKGFALPQGAQQSLDTIQSLLQALPKRLDPSGIAKALDGIMRQVPGGIGSILSLATGNNPIVGYALGHLAKEVGREAPEAAKLAFLRVLGSDAPVSAGGYRALFKFAEAAYKGQQALNKASSALFKTNADVLSPSMLPTDKQKSVISKTIRAAQVDPSILMNSTGEVGHYLPEQAGMLSESAGRTAMYLNSLRPSDDQESVLGPKRVPNSFEKARYNRALDIAQQPLVVLKHIKDGSLLPSDIQDLNSMHPGLYKTFQAKIMESLVDAQEDGRSIPYKMIPALSMFMGMPLDSSTKPTSIMMNQGLYAPQAPPQQGPIGPPKASKTGLTKTASLEATPLQARANVKGV